MVSGLNTPKGKTFTIVAVTILVSDVITKNLAQRYLMFHQPHEVIGDLVRFTLSYNTNAAFGMSVLGGSRWVYVGLTLVILITLIGMYREAAPGDRWQAGALGSIVGGALGNLVDRLRWERGVVDFIDAGIGDARFWTFNIADSGISVGATLMILLFIIHSRRRHAGVSEAGAGE
jgi:signal peptidase II